MNVMLTWHSGSLFPQVAWVPRLDQMSKSNAFCSLISNSLTCCVGEEPPDRAERLVQTERCLLTSGDSRSNA